MKHGPDTKCEHCKGWREQAERTILQEPRGCKVCQGWGWVVGCPGCGKIWGKFDPTKGK